MCEIFPKQLVPALSQQHFPCTDTLFILTPAPLPNYWKKVDRILVLDSLVSVVTICCHWY